MNTKFIIVVFFLIIIISIFNKHDKIEEFYIFSKIGRGLGNVVGGVGKGVGNVVGGLGKGVVGGLGKGVGGVVGGVGNIVGTIDIVKEPGIWAGRQAEALWNPISKPLEFGRDIIYNYTPNYTIIDRYLEKKNDLVRANKGLPIMKPSKQNLNLKFDYNTNKYGAEFGSNTIGNSIFNKIL
tara:strand:- start:3032 stop:3574 length:543 start_codon:yes stop_codon:yes gene_type:complete